jgi:ABC-type nitrate/sulfonate/bicarbonate transport system substrate-binding protein
MDMGQTVALRVQTGWYWDAEFIGYFLADDLGFYRDADLEVRFLEGGPTVNPEARILDGLADIAITVRDTTMALVRDGAPLEVLAAQYRHDPLSVLVGANASATSLADMAGLTIAVPSVSRISFLESLHRAGVDPGDVQTVSFHGSPAQMTAGGVDGVVGYVTSLPLDLARVGVRTRAIPLHALTDDVPQNLIVARAGHSPHLGPALKAWLRASARGWRVNARNPARYPSLLRQTWFSNCARSTDDEIRHNVRQLDFMGDPPNYLRTNPQIRKANHARHAGAP